MTMPLRGALIGYGLTVPPLALVFEFNPASLTRVRRVRVKTGSTPATRGGYDFALPTEAPRAAQGIEMEAEQFDLTVLLDATDRMNEGDTVASAFGVQPEIDTIRCMLEPKSQTPAGVQTLAALGFGECRAFAAHETASVLIFVWGVQILPVFLTQARLELKEFLPTLFPYRAEATLSLQVIESSNPFYLVEAVRQTVGAAMNTASTVASVMGGLY